MGCMVLGWRRMCADCVTPDVDEGNLTETSEEGVQFSGRPGFKHPLTPWLISCSLPLSNTQLDHLRAAHRYAKSNPVL